MHISRVTAACLGILFGVADFFVGVWMGCVLIIMLLLVVGGKAGKFSFGKFAGLAALLVIFSFLSFLYSLCYVHVHSSRLPEEFFGVTETITGQIVFDPDFGLTRTQVIIHPTKINTVLIHVPDRIVLELPPNENISYGEVVSVTGTLNHPENFTTDTDREFDYIHYLQLHSVYGTVRAKDISVQSLHTKSFPRDFLEPATASLFTFKHLFVKSLSSLFPPDQAGLLAGVLIGQKSLLSRTVLDELARSGLTHLIVLSGYNITVIALFMMQGFAWCGAGYRLRRILAICFIALFIGATGFSAAAVRPAIMISILFFLQMTTRPANIFRVICIVLVVMVLINPLALVYDPSLHLSFIGFLGLAYGTPVVEKILLKYISAIDYFETALDLLAETIAVQISVLPYIIWMNGVVSFLIVIANFITVPVAPIVMALGFFEVLLGMIPFHMIRLLTGILQIPLKLFLEYFLSISHMVASLNSLIVTVPPFDGWWIFGFYFIATVIALLVQGKTYG